MVYTIEVDFNSCDERGFVRLSTNGALRSIAEQNIPLRDGLLVDLLFDDVRTDLLPEDARVVGIIRTPSHEGVWCAEFDNKELMEKMD